MYRPFSFAIAASIAVLFVSGCASSPKVFNDPNGNVHLGVYADTYNFSAQMTRIKVELDGRPTVNKAFGTTSAGHRDSHYQIYLAPGTHTIHATANKGGAEATQTFEVKDQGHTFIAVQFQPATAPGGGGIKIKVSPTAIYVQPGQSI